MYESTTGVLGWAAAANPAQRMDAVVIICTLSCTYPIWYIQTMDRVLQAISDDSRRTVLSQLRTGPATVTQLASLLPIARPGVSRHLRVLREVGLVDVRNEGQRRIYSLRPEPLQELDEWLEGYRALWEQRLDALHTEVARGKRKGKKNDG